MSLRSRVSDIIHSKPGLTSTEISEIIYGPGGDRFQVNRICRDLVREGLVTRLGHGTRFSPFSYAWLLRSAAASSLSFAATAPAVFAIQQSVL